MRRVLDPHPASVREARRCVRDELLRAEREDLVDTAELVVSELVTNAVVHVGAGIELAAWVDELGLRVEVADGSPHAPQARHHAVTAGTGRGLRMVAQLVDRWGSTPTASGKVVWFELARGDREPGGEDFLVAGVYDDEPVDDPLAGAPGDSHGDSLGDSLGGALPAPYDVELLNVPLLLHSVWQQHAEALLRELLLIRIGEGSNTDELWAHALASEAMSLLLDGLPAPEVGEEAETLMVSAVEPFVSSEREVLRVPAEVVGHFRVLSETLDAAVGMADAGFLLTPPTQPEIRAFRVWVCAEIERQAAGERPLAWSDVSATAAPPPERATLDWDASEVSDSPLAVIAADDTNRVVAVSASALELLGYAATDGLVGRRLVAIIPPRFRQAHVAGFTLHLAHGRAPLLDHWVTVPVLLADGSEVDMRLLVASMGLPSGRHVFVARLEAA